MAPPPKAKRTRRRCRKSVELWRSLSLSLPFLLLYLDHRWGLDVPSEDENGVTLQQCAASAKRCLVNTGGRPA